MALETLTDRVSEDRPSFGAPVEISVVIPLYNEEDNAEELYRRLKEVLERIGRPYEIVFVDDGSRDATYSKLKAIHAADPLVTVVRLRRNFGQSAGLAAGFDQARGAIIIPMDGDLQHDPADIPKLLEKIEEGYDIASGWREKRVDNYLTRRLPSMVANRLMAGLSGVKLHDFGTTFKAYRREVLENVELYGELHRFIPALASWQGVKIAEVPINNVVRERGQSKYGLSRTFRVLMDLMTIKFLLSYLTRPLHFFGGIGLLFATTGSFVLLYVVSTLFGVPGKYEIGFALLGSLLVILGVQFLAVGLIAEVNSRIYHRTHRRKIYAIREILER